MFTSSALFNKFTLSDLSVLFTVPLRPFLFLLPSFLVFRRLFFLCTQSGEIVITILPHECQQIKNKLDIECSKRRFLSILPVRNNCLATPYLFFPFILCRLSSPLENLEPPFITCTSIHLFLFQSLIPTVSRSSSHLFPRVILFSFFRQAFLKEATFS